MTWQEKEEEGRKARWREPTEYQWKTTGYGWKDARQNPKEQRKENKFVVSGKIERGSENVGWRTCTRISHRRQALHQKNVRNLQNSLHHTCIRIFICVFCWRQIKHSQLYPPQITVIFDLPWSVLICFDLVGNTPASLTPTHKSHWSPLIHLDPLWSILICFDLVGNTSTPTHTPNPYPQITLISFDPPWSPLICPDLLWSATLPYHGSWHSTAQCCDPMPHVILSRQEHKQVPCGALLLANAALLLLSTFWLIMSQFGKFSCIFEKLHVQLIDQSIT